jgi:hypothetical protein
MRQEAARAAILKALGLQAGLEGSGQVMATPFPRLPRSPMEEKMLLHNILLTEA